MLKRISTIILTGIVVAVVPLVVSGQQPTYLDPSQPLEKRIDDLLPRLTLDEKASLMGTTAPAIERLRIPVMNGWNQALHGVVWTQPTTMFPVPIGMAATWDPALEQEAASVIGDEARAVFNYWHTVEGRVVEEDRAQITITAGGERIRHNGLVYRSPVINISRDPRWGRVDETFGEDPFLTSRMAVAFVKGMQGDNPKYLKTATTLKHYAVNNQEVDRHTNNAVVSERMLREYYLPQYKAGIVEGKAQSVMTVYNAINGVPGAANKKMATDILRGDWGFDGFVVPDSGAVSRLVATHKIVDTLAEAAARSVLAGHDLDNGELPRGVREAVAQGLLSEPDLDRALRRILRVRFRLGEFDPPEMVPYSRISPSIIASAPHRALALRAARESIVLLANRDNLLPLDRSQIKTIAVIGPHADYAMMGLGYTGESTNFVKPIDGIRNKMAPGTQVLYARGSGFLESDDEQASVDEAVAAARKADVAILFVGTNQLQEGEGRDRPNISLPRLQQRLVRAVAQANPKTVVVILSGGPVSLGSGRGPGGRGAGAEPAAVLTMFYAGEEGGNAIAEVLFGDVNPAGRLPYTVYANTRAIPPMTEYDITKGFTYMYFEGPTEYAFGHGLSYTNFDYSNLKLSAGEIPGDGSVTISVDVRNSGPRPGDEVVQLYVHDVEASVKRPAKELRGFERITLEPGEKETVSFTLPAEKLAFFDEKADTFVTEPGAFDALIGGSSDDIRVRGRFQVTTVSHWGH